MDDFTYDLGLISLLFAEGFWQLTDVVSRFEPSINAVSIDIKGAILALSIEVLHAMPTMKGMWSKS